MPSSRRWRSCSAARGAVRPLLFGILAGLTLALRFQLAPMVGVAMLIAALRWRWRGWPALFGFLFVVASAGALDAYTWGRWFSSIISNIELNVFAHVSDGFGTAPGYYYLLELGVRSAGLGYLGALGLALSWRKTWPLSVMGVAYVAALSVFGHKEWRFLMPLDPIYMIGSAVVFATYGRRLRPLVAPAFAALVAAIFVACTAAVILVLATGMKLGRKDVRQAYLMLSRLPDVKGVIDDSGGNWLYLGGYYYLHQAAPLYRDDLPATNVARVRQSPQLFASHWLTPADAAAPDGYVLLARSGRIDDLATQQGSARNAHRTRLLDPCPGSVRWQDNNAACDPEMVMCSGPGSAVFFAVIPSFVTIATLQWSPLTDTRGRGTVARIIRRRRAHVA